MKSSPTVFTVILEACNATTKERGRLSITLYSIAFIT
uniref:Uncharacterized protein n=1 Tax=Amphimedon queenslandica TaxID=400682 RepID=A0A1X7VPX8_AMPQE